MNEAILNSYLNVLQEGEPEYMTEGMREFLAKFDKANFKRLIDKLHNAFTNADADAFDTISKKSVQVTKKMPKYKEVEATAQPFKEANPDYGRSVDLAKKVIRNTFKIKDKAKLEIMSSAVAMTGWIKSKGGKRDVMRETKITLQDINTKVSNVYDTGFESLEASTPEEEEMKKKMMDTAKKQEKIEMIVVGSIMSILVASIVWVGVGIWGFFTSPAVILSVTFITFLAVIMKTALWVVGISTPIVLGLFAYKAKGK